jgi:hypothetical protein
MRGVGRVAVGVGGAWLGLELLIGLGALAATCPQPGSYDSQCSFPTSQLLAPTVVLAGGAALMLITTNWTTDPATPLAQSHSVALAAFPTSAGDGATLTLSGRF